MTIQALSLNQIRQLSPKIQAVCRSQKFYNILEQHGFDCGSFDGGCLIVATALQRCFNQGELWGAFGSSQSYNNTIRCHHAILKLGNLYYDGDGASSELCLKERWRRYEQLTVSHLAPLPAVDFPNHPETITALTKLFTKTLLQE